MDLRRAVAGDFLDRAFFGSPESGRLNPVVPPLSGPSRFELVEVMIEELIASPEFCAKFAMPQLNRAESAEVDLIALLRAAMQNPILYPPLAESLFSGDQIAIALQPELPRPQAVLESLFAVLGEMNIDPVDLTVVVTEATARELGFMPEQYRLPSETQGDQPPVLFAVEFGFNRIQFQVHDPDNQSGQSYLAANAEGEPVYVNRILVDADVVLPIGFPVPGAQSRQVDCVYPGFSTTATKRRFQSDSDSSAAQQDEIDLANDMLGSFFRIQIVSGPGNSIQEVLCGVRRQTIDQAELAVNDLWSFQFEEQVEMVLASLESNPEDQTWEDWANALCFADRLVLEGGPIMVWSDISRAPGKALAAAFAAQFEGDDAVGKLPGRMQQVARILSERQVFLKSRLDRNVVEDLGLGYFDSKEEVLRVAMPFQQGLLIRDAHRCHSDASSLTSETHQSTSTETGEVHDDQS